MTYSTTDYLGLSLAVPGTGQLFEVGVFNTNITKILTKIAAVDQLASDTGSKTTRLEYKLAGVEAFKLFLGVLTPVAVNVPISQHIDFQFDSKPVVLVGAETGSPQNVRVSASNVSATGCDVVLVRSDNTSPTGFHLIAIDPEE